MRSVHTAGSVHAHRALTSLSRLVVADTAKSSCCSVRVFSTHHLPASLRSTSVTTLLRYYGGSDFLPPHSLRQVLPDSLTRASDRSVLIHQVISHDRFLTLLQRHALRAGPFPVCALSRLGFAIGWKARQITRPNQVPSVRTGHSPSVALHPVSPRMQLRSALVNERLTRRDFHPSARVRSRAHHPAFGHLLPASG